MTPVLYQVKSNCLGKLGDTSSLPGKVKLSRKLGDTSSLPGTFSSTFPLCFRVQSCI